MAFCRKTSVGSTYCSLDGWDLCVDDDGDDDEEELELDSNVDGELFPFDVNDDDVGRLGCEDDDEGEANDSPSMPFTSDATLVNKGGSSPKVLLRLRVRSARFE